MEATFTYLCRGVSAEALKIKHTWAFWLALLAPLSIVSMTFLVFFFKGEKILLQGQDPWPTWVGNNFNVTAQLLLPLFLTLLTALVNGAEHSSLGWKQLYAAPVPRWSVPINKYLLQLGLVLLSFLAFLVGLVAAGYLLGWLRPELGFQDFHHIGSIARGAFRILMGSLFVFTMQFCLSFRFKSIGLSIGLGILFTMAFLIGLRWEHIGYYPYSWPYFAAVAFFKPEAPLFLPEMIYSLVASLVLLLSFTWYSTRRQVL